MHLGASREIFHRAQILRANETKAEKLVWERLARNQLGIKFRRQHPILHYVVDFYCHSLKLVIELDGSVHEGGEQQFHDKNREETLNSYGIRVIRFTNEQVFSDLDQVIQIIEKHLLSSE